MATYERIFVIPDVGRTHILFRDLFRLAEQIEKEAGRTPGAPRAAATMRELLRAYASFNSQLDDLAKVTAAAATKEIRRQIGLTAVRPDTGVKPHLRDLIRCRPLRPAGKLATGTVGIADIDWLNKAINPASPEYGTYWMAQEFGSTAQVGRVIRGFFFGSGYGGAPSAPQAQYAGGGGPHPIFVTARSQRALYGDSGFSGGAGSQGGVGGFGTIRHPIRPRHFIQKGADQALGEWRRGIRLITKDVETQLRAV